MSKAPGAIEGLIRSPTAFASRKAGCSHAWRCLVELRAPMESRGFTGAVPTTLRRFRRFYRVKTRRAVFRIRLALCVKFDESFERPEKPVQPIDV